MSEEILEQSENQPVVEVHHEIENFDDVDSVVQALEEKMVGLLQDPASRERLSVGALAWAREFNWDNAATRTVEILQEYLRMNHS